MYDLNYNAIWSEKWGDMQKYGPVHRHHRRIFKNILRDIKFGSVLDVGCGEGSNLAFLSKINKDQKLEMVGIDVSDNAINKAKKILVGSSFFVKDCQIERLERKFDLVICSDVVEHLPDDVSAITNMKEMTGGYCLIATVQGRMRGFEKNIGHIRNYGYGELRDKMEDSGFTVIKEVEWGWPLYSPLYRNLLDCLKMEKVTGGEFGFFRKAVSSLLYYLFFLNSSKKGDVIFILAKIK